MITQVNVRVRPAKFSDRQKLANLIHFETYVHRHLDWINPLDWIEHQPYLVMERGKELLATLACPPDPPGISWIRIFVGASTISIDEAWQTLWLNALENLSTGAVSKVAVIPLQEWYQQLLINSGFTSNTRVVMLLWNRQELPPVRQNKDMTLRPMTLDDITTVTSLDNIAFNPLWRISKSSLEIAFRQAAVATVVDYKGILVGYQISTANQIGGHLARMAIHPEYQGSGIGYTLLHDLLLQFKRRGARQVTVNTQEGNIISLGLYKKAGFIDTREEYQVFELELVPTDC